MSERRYIVAGCKSWNRKVFEDAISHYPGRWIFVSQPDELTQQFVEEYGPEYIFFLHWSWKVPEEIFNRCECICFHMTDVPYGRGGSPLQNLIVRGHRETKLTALQMVEAFDAGPVYLKESLSLHGSAEEIYTRAAHLASRMILTIISESIAPEPQVGEPVNFKRRRPEDGRLSGDFDLEKLYDHIRMLDAEGYPPAFFEYKGHRYEFSQADLRDGQIIAQVTISPMEHRDDEHTGNSRASG